MSNVVTDLKAQIAAGKIIFDAGEEDKLEKELLGQNTGTRVTAKLQSLVLELSKRVSSKIRVSSLVRSGGTHGAGRAVDVGNEEIAGGLLPQVATPAEVAALNIDDIIFDAQVAGKTDRNHWNYNAGIKHNFDKPTLDAHEDHIHFSVMP